MTDGSQALGAGPPPLPRRKGPDRYGLDAIGLISGAFLQVQAQWRAALGLWLVGVALSWGTLTAARALGAAVQMPGLLPARPEGNLAGYLAFHGVSVTASALLGALTLRLLLAPGTAWWRPDRRLAAATAILALISLVFTIIGFGELAQVRPVMPAQLLARSGMILTALVVELVVTSYLVLWPAGAAIGDWAMTPIRSWRLMGGHVASYIGATLLLQVPFALWSVGSVFMGIRHGAAGVIEARGLVLAAVTPGTTLLSRAMAARLYGALAATSLMRSPGASTKR